MKKTVQCFFLLMLCGVWLGLDRVQSQQKPTPVYYFNPDWSRDGSKLLFESTREGKYALYTININGTGLRRLTDLTADNGQARWSANNKQIVFYSGRDGHLQLYLMNADGSHQRRLTNDDDVDYLADFSPKGDQVAYVSHPQTGGGGDNVYVIRTDGTGRTRLTDPATSNSSPRWSPNGEKVLFTQGAIVDRQKMTRAEMTKAGEASEIFVMDKDGSNKTNLTKNNVNDFGGRWSRDGQTIFFHSKREGQSNTYAMNIDGSSVRKVFDGSMAPGAMSPNEKYWAYTKDVDGKWGLYIYDIKSGKERLVIGG